MEYKKIKRILDIVLVLTGLVLLSPLFLIASILIKVESKGPIIFKQTRLGLKGKQFEIYKFRSMKLNAEKEGVYEKKGDTRVTKVGKVIRKTSIDELPQFINILKGDVSLIGPRPPLTYHPWNIEEYTEEQKKMFEVRPGVTGWAQVNGRKDVPWDQRIKMNVYYVESMSFKLDVIIFLKTFEKVIKNENNINIDKTL